LNPVPAQRDTSAAARFIVREATADDREVLARHRCEMFSDMGSLRGDAYPELAKASAKYFAEAIPRGEYVAWLVEPAGEPGTVVAGGGVQLRQILPRPDAEGGVQRPGPQGLIVNVYTEKAWRRRGLAELVMRRIISWSRENGVVGLVLHPSNVGRSLYEKLGFAQSSEMYYTPFVTGEDDPS
jgi:GNAT superfamily N-acetyltransferase